jgi:hypothetical protein
MTVLARKRKPGVPTEGGHQYLTTHQQFQWR